MKSRKKELQQLLAEARQSTLGGQVVSIRIIQPAHQLVGGENLTGDICQPALHVGRLCGFASYVENQVIRLSRDREAGHQLPRGKGSPWRSNRFGNRKRP